MNREGKRDLYVIFEGPTEKKFLDRMKNLFDTKVNIIQKNAEGVDNIVSLYKTTKKKNRYNDVIVMYDLDNIRNVNDIISIYKNKDIKITRKEIYFINPKFELIFVLCKVEETPTSRFNIYIRNLYSVNNYSKTDAQLKSIVMQISKEDILSMLDRIQRLLSLNDSNPRSTNYDKLFSEMFVI